MIKIWVCLILSLDSEIDKINWFFTGLHKLMQIKTWLKIFGVGMAKNGCGQSGGWTFKLTSQGSDISNFIESDQKVAPYQLVVF